ncbi:hypothetical protein [Peribacillus sp. FSL M8-0224]
MYISLQEVLEKNIINIKMNFNNTSDLIIREVEIGAKTETFVHYE